MGTLPSGTIIHLVLPGITGPKFINLEYFFLNTQTSTKSTTQHQFQQFKIQHSIITLQQERLSSMSKISEFNQQQAGHEESKISKKSTSVNLPPCLDPQQVRSEILTSSPSTNLPPPTRPLKILMIHNDAASGRSFHKYTTPLRSTISSSLPSHGISFYYPTAPSPKILPKINPHIQTPYNSALVQPISDPDTWSWGFGHWNHHRINGLAASIHHLLKYMKKNGPFDGIVAFSAGAGMAGVLISIVERGLTSLDPELRNELDLEGEELLTGIQSFKFAILFSGFRLSLPRYRSLYTPQLKIKSLHFLGTRDGFVRNSDTNDYAGCFEGSRMVRHKGRHEIPRGLEEVGGFMREVITGMGEGEEEGRKRIGKIKCKL